MKRQRLQLAFCGLLGTAAICAAQRLPQADLSPAIGMVRPAAITPPGIAPAMIKPVVPPCVTSAEPFDVDDYSGPLNNMVARISQRVESTTVRLPRHASAAQPCAMDTGDKFRAFIEESFDPVSFAGAAWDAAIAQMTGDDAPYRQGAAGFGRRYSAAVTDNFTGSFFTTFFYPAVFHQDPRYFRLGQGPVNARLGHALAHRFVARSDSGKNMFNYSEWMAAVSTKALSNLYHPGNPRGLGPTASRVGVSVANDVAWDVLREFWPEIAHKLRLPFRTHPEMVATAMPALRPLRPTTPVIADPVIVASAE